MTSAQQPSVQGRRLKLVLVAVIIVVILVVAGFALVVSGPRAKLTVTDGSITCIIQGDSLEVDVYNMSVLFFNATSYADETDHPSSTITLQLSMRTYCDNATKVMNTAFWVTVLGNLSSNLRAQSVQIAYNQTAHDSGVDSMGNMQGTNVTFKRSARFSFWNNDSGALTAKLVNRSESDSNYRFSFSDTVLVYQYQLDKNSPGVRFLYFRGLVNGWFEPEFSVGIALKIVDTSAAV